ncbi:MAG: methyltransferase domain-containing protein [Sphingobacteriales bacterium]|nr:methyltransferase domain-containing protein [Sphingobacteriales bacterium]
MHNYFKHYIPIFEKKLNAIDVQSLAIAPYCKRYLKHLLQNTKYYLSIYAEVLEKVKKECITPIIEMHLLDYGAGNGLLGLFAKCCGFGKVSINDIDESFLSASKVLAKQMGIDIHQFILGDLDEVKKIALPEKIDALVATDLIEHIYDLDEFVSTMKSLNPELIFVFTTGSNPENYFKVRQLMKLQLRDELIGGSSDDALLFGHEAHEPYLKIREKIIKDDAPELDENIILKLAKLTRGNNKSDIIKGVKKFKETKELPLLIKHPTNTCHPETGSWTERLMPISTYKSIFHQHQFELQISSGFYNHYQPGIKGFVSKFLNKTKAIVGLKLDPFIILT